MSKFKNVFFGILVFIVEVLFCFIIWKVITNTKVKQLVATSTTIMPERFTELYFEDHIKLPDLPDADGLLNFNFVIHNLESVDTNYEYLISVINSEESKRVIKRENIFVKNNEYKVIAVQIENIGDVRSQIVVELPNKNQYVSYWVGK